MSEQFSEQIAAGAAVLDEVRPGWWKPGVIDLPTLEMERCSACVVGQLTGAPDYLGIEALGIKPDEYGWTRWPEELGFSIATFPVDADGEWISLDDAYRILTDEWRAAILDRRGQGS